MTRRSWIVAGAAALALLPFGSRSGRTGSPAEPHVDLVWYAETADGTVVAEQNPDLAINPASLVKVATSLFALERLGPGHRFATRFGFRGLFDAATGRLDGDLLVLGGNDPDFHVENAWLVARELNQVGLREVTGSLRVDAAFSIGWEGGSERREGDPARRAEIMAGRLRDALDPARWNRATRESIGELVARRGEAEGSPPRVIVHGGPGAMRETEPAGLFVTHRSNPLGLVLKRFNAYSNNDIERLEPGVGSPAELARKLAERFEVSRGRIGFETLSGLGSNRMTPRLVVRLMRELVLTCEKLGLSIGEILPVAGCDPGTLDRIPYLSGRVKPGAIAAKTGTLIRTDGGVAVLAGVARAKRTELIFCVAAIRNGSRVDPARRAQARWLETQIVGQGGVTPGRCGARLPFPDEQATVEVAR